MMLDQGSSHVRPEVSDSQAKRPPEKHVNVGGHVFEESLVQKVFNFSVEDFQIICSDRYELCEKEMTQRFDLKDLFIYVHDSLDQPSKTICVDHIYRPRFDELRRHKQECRGMDQQEWWKAEVCSGRGCSYRNHRNDKNQQHHPHIRVLVS